MAGVGWSAERVRLWLGGAALLGAVLGMVADYCLLYSPNGGYLKGDYLFLRDIPLERMLWGHYLGILAIPLEAAGIYLIYELLLPVGRRFALVMGLVGLYLLFLGVSYHASVYAMGGAVQLAPELVEVYRPFNEPLGLGFVVGFLGLMVPLGWCVGTGRTRLGRWWWLASPGVTYLVWMGMVLAGVGDLVGVMGFNLSLGVWVGVVVGEDVGCGNL